MLFSSMTFLWVFFPCVFFGCLCLRKNKFQNVLLLTASLVFYAWGEPRYVFLMAFSIVVNWLLGLTMERATEHKKLVFVVAILVNLLLLGYYKYYAFFVDTINNLLKISFLPQKKIALPIGISFYTFQAMSYIIDLYRGKYKAQRNIIHLGLYISFFPQLIAGPIVKYTDINAQITSRNMSAEKIAVGFRHFAYGLGKKVLIANVLAQYVDSAYKLNVAQISGGAVWCAAIAYTLQIYYDFSGYSDMAIGLARIFGFDLLENFNHPYLSSSIHEFWQRWHISLGTWFREYVYYPLGGNQKGSRRTYLNLSVVFLLTGLWHGASWNFVFWGVYHGFFQILERIWLGRFLEKTKLFKHVYAIFIVTVGWVFFRIENIKTAAKLVRKMIMPWKYIHHWKVGAPGVPDALTIIVVLVGVFGSGVLQLIAERHKKLEVFWKDSFLELLYCASIMLLSFMQLASNTYNPFIYFRF